MRVKYFGTLAGVKGFMGDLARLRYLWPDLRGRKRLLAVSIVLVPMVAVFQMAVPMILRWGIDQGIAKGDRGILLSGAVVYLLVVFLDYLARSVQGLTTSLAVFYMIQNLRRKLVCHILSLSASFHDRMVSGTLVTRATSDVENLSDSLDEGILGAAVDIAVLVGSMAGLFILNWEIALSVFAGLPLVGFVVTWFSRMLKGAMLIARRKMAELNGFTQECFYGSSTVKLLTAEGVAWDKYRRLCYGFRDAQMKSVMLDAFLFALIDGMASVTIGVMLWLGLVWLELGNSISAGVLVAVVQYIHQLFDPLKQLGNKMAMLQGAFTSMDRIFNILNLDDHVQGVERPPEIEGSVILKDVSFRYRVNNEVGQGVYVLSHLSFSVEQGKSVALVGATGGGKSTIVKLIAKLYDGYEGSITIDGREIRSWDGELLRKRIAFVPQDIVLFSGTVGFNIGLGAETASPNVVIQAAREVGADSFIRRLEGGYDFVIQEGGGNLSQGQRQLITFARALAGNPRIMILDEATSSVDARSESMVQEAISRILAHRTVIVIAHRLSTIEKCNRILVIEHGKLVEQGTHGELLEKKGAYFQLHRAMG